MSLEIEKKSFKTLGYLLLQSIAEVKLDRNININPEDNIKI